MMIMQVGKDQNPLFYRLRRGGALGRSHGITLKTRLRPSFDFWKSVYDGIFDSISDMGSIDDEIDIKVFKTNKDGETIVTDEQAADKTTKPKATKEAAKTPAVSKPSEEERFESQICQ